VVAEHGFGGATVGEVAVRAGIPKSSLYRRFESREEVLVAMGRDAIAHQRAVPDTGSLRGDLTDLANQMIDAINERHHLIQLAVAAVNDSDLRAVANKLFGDGVSAVAEILARAEARGELASSIDPAPVMELLSGQLWARFLGQQPVDLAHAAAGIDIVLRGIAASPAD
jgi:AcrR family transcriptional regulator